MTPRLKVSARVAFPAACSLINRIPIRSRVLLRSGSGACERDLFVFYQFR